uniref:Uncharacterized protein n=1 Tax=Oryza punctata TaxID=4537 RepID=A0A0E0MHS3_ORYPU
MFNTGRQSTPDARDGKAFKKSRDWPTSTNSIAPCGTSTWDSISMFLIFPIRRGMRTEENNSCCRMLEHREHQRFAGEGMDPSLPDVQRLQVEQANQATELENAVWMKIARDLDLMRALHPQQRGELCFTPCFAVAPPHRLYKEAAKDMYVHVQHQQDTCIYDSVHVAAGPIDEYEFLQLRKDMKLGLIK